ncbi:uncharacterized protein LOC126656794 [Mercurialis annua]|uniref:uncharacterized protein LOC126656794 n=1 Tax=Mercurialis annua TaxID=3986 RepID=UPI00216102E0|nr:uncharacterized protein LOC126656794 [Mercurialis annua]
MAYVNSEFDNPSNPFYLHPSENPSLILISPPLNGQNYHSWARSMKMCLMSKNKLKFVNGSITVPMKEDPIYAVWERCNTMVLSWILRSLSPSIAQSIFWIDTALDAWRDLLDRFSQGNAIRISDLQEEIYVFKQNNLSVTDYFTQLKILWDEYMNLRFVPTCTCNPQCSCQALKIVKTQQEDDYIIRFLKGLTENFATVRTQILMVEPLPKINKVFSLVLQHERQMGIGFSESVSALQIVEPAVFATQENSSFQKKFTGNNFGINRPGNFTRPSGYNNRPGNFTGNRMFVNRSSGVDKPLCTFCGISGHTVDICFKKHGYPPGYKPRPRIQGYVNQVGEFIAESEQERYYNDQEQICYNNGEFAEHEKAERNCVMSQDQDMHREEEHAPVFTQEQYKQLMSMLQQNASTSGHKINTISTNFVSTSAATDLDAGMKISNINSVYTNFENDCWIIDSGATDHIVCSMSYFSSYKPVDNVFVTLPNSQKISVTHIGAVKFSKECELHDVLFVPKFFFNLISTSKLTSYYQYCLILHKDVCIIQDVINWRMIGLARKTRGLYQLDKSKFENRHVISVNAVNAKPVANDFLWHNRLGHLANSRLKCLQDQCSIIKLPSDSHCKICHLAKQKKLSFPLSTSVSNNCFDMIHVDIWGPSRTVSIYGHRYFLTIVDDKSRYTWLFLLKSKSGVRLLVLYIKLLVCILLNKMQL